MNEIADSRLGSSFRRIGQLKGTFRPLSQDLGYQGTDGKTIGCYWSIPSTTRGIIFIHSNYSAATSSTIQSAYALSAELGNGVDPTDGRGSRHSDDLFRNVTWNGEKTVEIPRAVTDKRVPSLVYSDPMPIYFPVAHEVGRKVHLFIRDYSAKRHSADSYDANTKSIVESAFYGFGGGWANNRADASNGHFVTPGQMAGASGAGLSSIGYLVPHAIQCILDRPAITVLQTGDSINSGVSADDGVLFPALVACQSLEETARFPAFPVNQALSGDVSVNFIQRAKLSLQMGPTVALVQCYSRNDQNTLGDTLDTAMATYNRAVIFCSECLNAGVVPILETSSPFGGSSNAEGLETIRRSINSLVRESGLPFVDYDKLLGTGESPNKYAAIFSSDGVHPNTTGITAMGRAAADVIRSVLQI